MWEWGRWSRSQRENKFGYGSLAKKARRRDATSASKAHVDVRPPDEKRRHARLVEEKESQETDDEGPGSFNKKRLKKSGSNPCARSSRRNSCPTKNRKKEQTSQELGAVIQVGIGKKEHDSFPWNQKRRNPALSRSG